MSVTRMSSGAKKVKLIEMTFPGQFCQGTGQRQKAAICSSAGENRKSLLVNGELLFRLLQFDGDFVGRLGDVKIFAIRAEAMGNHLDP